MYQKPSIIFSKPVQSENKKKFQNPEKCHNQTIAASERKSGSMRRIKKRAKQADTGLRNSGSKVTQAEAGPGGKRRRRPPNLSPEKSVEKEGVAAGPRTPLTLCALVWTQY